ncbi:MFS transporter [Geodermatophilus sp. SYSU D00708]
MTAVRSPADTDPAHPATSPDHAPPGAGAAPWLVAVAATTALAVVLGVFGTVGVLIDPLADEFGAPRAHLVLLFPLALLVHAVTAPVAGAAVDRWGPRPLLAVAGLGTAIGLLAPAIASELEVAVVGYELGLGLAAAATWVATTVSVSAAFDRRRSAALGLLLAGPAAGGTLLAPALTALIQAQGPRVTCAVLAALGAGVCAVATVLLPDRPPGRGARTASASDRTSRSAAPGLRRFYAAALVMSLVVFLPVVHVVGSAVDLGLSAGRGAAVLAVISITSALARLGGGWLATPRRLPALYRGSHLLMAAGLAVWAVTDGVGTFPMLLGFAVLFGAGYGAWLSLGPAVLAATCPPQQLGRALGRLAAATGVGGVVGPLLSAPLLPGARLPVLAGAAVLALGAASLLTDGRPLTCAAHARPAASARPATGWARAAARRRVRRP